MTRASAIKFFKAITLIGVYGGLLVPPMFIPVVIFPFVFSKLIFLQVLIGITFPAYVALAWMEPAYRPKKHILTWALLWYFAAVALSVVFAVDPMRAWWGNQERMNGLFTLLHFLAWFLMITGVIRTWDEWKKLLRFEVCIAGFMAVVAMLQKLNPSLLMFPAGPRVGGLVDNPIYMAAYQIFNLFFLALLWWKETSKGWKWAYGFIAALATIAFFLAQSRGALVGLAVGLVAFTFYVGVFSTNKKHKLAVLGGLVAMGLGYGGLFLAKDVPFIKASPLYRLVDFQASITTRLIAWDIAWKGFKERPLTGWGFDNFHIIFNQHYNPQSLRFGQYETWFDRAHNTVLDVMSMTGLFGLIGFVAIYLAIFYSSWRAYKKGWIDLPIAALLFSLPIAYFVQNLFVFDHPAGFTMSYLLFALVVGATHKDFVGEKSKEEAKEEVAGRREAPWIAYGALSAVMVFVVWAYSYTPFKISTIALKSNGIISSNPQMGINLAKEARNYGWTPYLDEQSFLLSRNLISIAGAQPAAVKSPIWQEGYQLAKEISLEEIARHSANTHPRFILARLAQEAFVGTPAEGQVSLEQYQEAIKLSPKRQQLHFSVARLYLMAGRVDEAATVLKNVTEFDPEAGEPFWNYGLTLLFDKKDIEGGVAALMQSQTATYPYRFQSGRELIVLTDAIIQSGNQQVFDRFVAQLSNTDYFPRLSATEYGQIAARFHQENRLEMRDAFLEAAKAIDPNTLAEYTRILTAPAATTTTQAPATAPAAVSTTPTQPVASGTYRGPRN